MVVTFIIIASAVSANKSNQAHKYFALFVEYDSCGIAGPLGVSCATRVLKLKHRCADIQTWKLTKVRRAMNERKSARAWPDRAAIRCNNSLTAAKPLTLCGKSGCVYAKVVQTAPPHMCKSVLACLYISPTNPRTLSIHTSVLICGFIWCKQRRELGASMWWTTSQAVIAVR